MKIPAGIQAILNAVTGRSLRKRLPSNDGEQSPVRTDKYDELVVKNVWNSFHQLLDEGSLYVAQTATPGTGITLSSATGTTYSDTQAIFGVNNLDTTPALGGQGRDVIPLWLKLIITGAGTAGTDDHYASRLDQGARVSGGTAQLIGKNLNPSYAANDDLTYIAGGVPTVAAATNQVRNCGRAEGRKAAAPAYVVGDVVMFLFGVVEAVAPQAVTPTTATILTLPLPGVVIPPGWSWVLNEWMTARTAAQAAEIEFGYAVR